MESIMLEKNIPGKFIMKKLSFKSSLLLLLALACALPAGAADDKKAGKEQVRQMQQMQRKLQQEKSQLAQEKTALDGQLKETKDMLDATKRSADTASRRRTALVKELEVAAADKAALAVKLTDMEIKLADTEKKLVDTTETLRRVEGAKIQVESNLTQRSQSLATCETKNETQHKYGMEILDKYQKKGCTSALLQSEPFTGLKQVQIENMAESYREKYDQQKVDLNGVTK